MASSVYLDNKNTNQIKANTGHLNWRKNARHEERKCFKRKEMMIRRKR